jgi:hypothetical protein
LTPGLGVAGFRLTDMRCVARHHHLDGPGDRQLNGALHRLAVNQGRVRAPAPEHLAGVEAATHTRREALGRLKRHVVHVVFRLLQANAEDVDAGESRSPMPALA